MQKKDCDICDGSGFWDKPLPDSQVEFGAVCECLGGEPMKDKEEIIAAAISCLTENSRCGGLSEEEIRVIIVAVMAEQDRNTRHACAEACLQATNGAEHLEIISKAYHDLCINTRAI